MNGKKARKIRRMVYGQGEEKKDFRKRTYAPYRRGITTVEVGMKISTRRIYQKMKKKLTCVK